MKIIFTLFSAVALLVLASTNAFAAPFNAEDKNPQVVAFYEEGTHGIVGESETHTGIDLVMLAGHSGNLQQWFYGNSTEDGGIIEGDHSVWQISKDGTCSEGWDLVEDAYPEWGDYLTPGADYCVKTNDFHVTK